MAGGEGAESQAVRPKPGGGGRGEHQSKGTVSGRQRSFREGEWVTRGVIFTVLHLATMWRRDLKEQSLELRLVGRLWKSKVSGGSKAWGLRKGPAL